MRIRVLVTGGRRYRDRDHVFRVLDRIHAERGIETIVQGGAGGADRLAREWARERRVALEWFTAEWDRYGRAAGPLRNQRMIDEGNLTLGVAFPGHDGTADCVRRIERANIELIDERSPSPSIRERA